MKPNKRNITIKSLFLLAGIGLLTGCGTPYNRDDVANLSNYELAKCRGSGEGYRKNTIKMCREEMKVRLKTGAISQQELSVYDMQLDNIAIANDQLTLDALQTMQPNVIRVQPGYAYPPY